MIPVVWVSYRKPAIASRGYWDQGLIERVMARSAWRPVGALEYSHNDGFEELPVGADGAVVVVPAQHHHLPDEVARLNADMAALDWVVLILTGDECSLFPWRQLDHPNMALWVMTPRPNPHAGCPAFFLGEGYREDVPTTLAGYGPEAADKGLDWFFAGQVTHQRRRALVAALRRLSGRGELVETPGFTQGLAPAVYLRKMAEARVVPCPSGPGTPDSFRLYEALEAGALPIADATTPEGWEGFWSHVYGEVPFPVVQEWRTVPRVVRACLAGWPANVNRAGAWWAARKREMAYRLDDDVRRVGGGAVPVSAVPSALADLITVVVPTSPIPSHPDPGILNETMASVRARMPACEVLLMADGVRPEQEHRRDDYEEYLRRALWSANHQWRNVLPLIHDEHLHQAEMTRRALELVRTPLVLFVEHDTPLIGDIPFADLVTPVCDGRADVVRLHHEASILEPHRYLMVDPEPVYVDGLPMQRTAQWSQRPHLARASWYRDMLAGHFPAHARTMIEDAFYSAVATPWIERGEWGSPCRLWMFTPPGDIKRSGHLDGRAGDPKFEMIW